MSDKNSCINLGVIFPANYVIGFILRDFGVHQYCPVIEFCDFGFFSMPVDLDLFRINFGSAAKPSLRYP